MRHYPPERPSEINAEPLSWEQGGGRAAGSEEGREGGAGNTNSQEMLAWVGSLQGSQETVTL